ncbi:MAG: single-stranded-DNA-specific exonuclease RecJ [Clostridia bacterium]|nr:single-stranded-DNA-specific exonuclease RecJ [Clostridia bacterium]
MNKKWEIYDADEQKIQELKEKYNIPEIVAKVLVDRNVIKDEDIEIYLNPTRNDFHDPFLMPDMDKAVNEVLNAIKLKEKTIIYGDYDVDGITSITVLKKFLEEQGMEVDYYIPNRLDEGYGLNKTAIEKIAKDGYKLIITVDCGISGIEEVELANKLGMRVLVTDHHEPGEQLPNALAVVDAKRKDSKYPCNVLAGVGVAFKLIQGICIKLGLDEKEYLKYLDIVCVGTISDIVPLIDENRVIAKLGLKLVEQTKNVGLKALIKASGYKSIDSNMISFGITPRINACGRMGYEQEGAKLFLTDNITNAVNITERLNKYNRERQATEKKIFEEAIEKLDTEPEQNSIVLSAKGWHHGVIGIVASKLTEIYYKPCILLCEEGEEAKGSGRSIPGFDLYNALCKCSETLEKYGGHGMAVGLTLRTDKIDDFKQQFRKTVEDANIGDLEQVIWIDKQVEIKELDIESIEKIKLLEPFGEGNKMPVFMLKNLRIDSIRALSEGKHLKLTLKDGNQVLSAIGFNMGELANEYLLDDKVDVVGHLEINEYRRK